MNRTDLPSQDKLSIILEILKAKENMRDICEKNGIPLHEAELWLAQFIEYGRRRFELADNESGILVIFEQIRKTYETAIQLYANGERILSLLMYARTIFLIDELGRLMALKGGQGTAYNLLKDDQIPSFEKDLTDLSRVDIRSASLNVSFSEAEMLLLTERIKSYFETVDHEIKTLFPKASFVRLMIFRIRFIWNKYLKRYDRYIFAGLAVLFIGFSFHLFRKHQEGKKHGLIGEYYADTSLKRLIYKQKDKNIDFNWGMRPPLRSMMDTKDFFSVRWTGKIEMPKAGMYEITTRSDDGVRVWIDNELVINDWGPGHFPALVSSYIRFDQGLHDIKIEYFENRGLAVLELYWKHEDQNKKQIIPVRYFYPY